MRIPTPILSHLLKSLLLLCGGRCALFFRATNVQLRESVYSFRITFSKSRKGVEYNFFFFHFLAKTRPNLFDCCWQLFKIISTQQGILFAIFQPFLPYLYRSNSLIKQNFCHLSEYRLLGYCAHWEIIWEEKVVWRF